MVTEVGYTAKPRLRMVTGVGYTAKPRLRMVTEVGYTAKPRLHMVTEVGYTTQSRTAQRPLAGNIIFTQNFCVLAAFWSSGFFFVGLDTQAKKKLPSVSYFLKLFYLHQHP